MSRPDQLAEQYRVTRDPRHLADLFDATAEHLLRVAHWLTGDAHAAEDVVQDTFLTYVDRIAAYDPNRPVLPWLTGIAANLARRWNARHRSQNARVTEAGQARLASATMDAASGPLASAEVSELQAQLASAIDRLPRAYAQVLRLSLEHDLSPSEIASALCLPGGTVRSRLSRGLMMLRPAIPAGVAGAGVFVATSTAGLCAVRQTLLRHAVAAAVPCSAVAVASTSCLTRALLACFLAMKTSSVLISAAILASLAAFAAMWWPQSPTTPKPNSGTSAEISSPMPAGVLDRGPLAGEVSGVTREPVVAGAVPSVLGRAVTGRAVADETGEPLAGAVFRLLATPHDHVEAGRIAEVVTGPDGYFELPVPEDAKADLLAVMGEAPDRIGIYGVIARDKLGDIAFATGPQVSLRVVDQDGVAVPYAWLSLTALAEPKHGQALRSVQQHLRLRADDHGVVSVERVAAGRCRVAAIDPLRMLEPMVVTLRADQERHEAVVTLLGRVGDLVIEGMVVDPDGLPVVGVDLTIDSGSLHMSGAKSDARGRFRLVGAPTQIGGGESVSLSVHPPEEFHRPTPTQVAWGQRDVRIALQSVTSSKLEVAVHDAQTGAQLDDYSVRCANALGGQVLEAESDPANRVAILSGVRLGPNFVTAFPRDGSYLNSETVRFDHVVGGEQRLRLAVHRSVPQRVRVSDAGGEPVVGTRVELLRVPEWVTQWNEASATVDWLSVSRRAESADNEYGYSHGPTLVDAARTNHQGEVVLRAVAGRVYGVRALGPGHAPLLLKSVVAAAQPVVALCVVRGATLKGHFEGAQQVREFGRIALVSVSDPGYTLPNHQIESLAVTDQRIAGASATMSVGADGHFSFENLPEGSWRLVLENVTLQDGRPAWNRVPFPDLVELRDGMTSEIVLDGSWLRLGRIEGTIRFDGNPIPQGRVVAESAETGSLAVASVTAAAAPVQADGSFVFARMPAGRYRLSLQHAEEQTSSHVLGPWIDLRPGQLEVVPVDITTSNLELQVVRDGKPLIATSIWLARVVAGQRVTSFYGRTNAVGMLRLKSVPPGSYQVSGYASGKDFCEVSVLPQHSGEWVTATVKLPAPR